MKKFLVYLLLAINVICPGLAGCSKEGSVQTDSKSKSVKEEAPNPWAERIGKGLRTPIDKARAAQGLGEEHTNAIDEALKRK
jgi:hypothetical protein